MNDKFRMKNIIYNLTRMYGLNLTLYVIGKDPNDVKNSLYDYNNIQDLDRIMLDNIKDVYFNKVYHPLFGESLNELYEMKLFNKATLAYTIMSKNANCIYERLRISLVGTFMTVNKEFTDYDKKYQIKNIDKMKIICYLIVELLNIDLINFGILDSNENNLNHNGKVDLVLGFSRMPISIYTNRSDERSSSNTDYIWINFSDFIGLLYRVFADDKQELDEFKIVFEYKMQMQFGIQAKMYHYYNVDKKPIKEKYNLESLYKKCFDN